MKSLKKYATFLILLSLLLLCIAAVFFLDRNRKPERYQVTYLDVFDTVTQIVGYDTSEEAFREKADLLHDKLLFYHKQYDIYHTYPDIQNLATINQNAGIAPVAAEDAVLDLLEFSIEVHQKTAGKTNIAMGSVLRLWHEHRTYGSEHPEEATLPSMDELLEAAFHTGIDQICIDSANGTVFLEDPALRLDVGSIGKGYAVEKTAAYARELGFDHLVISVGGNISAIGTMPSGEDWRFGIQNPFTDQDEALIAKVDVSDRSVVTSGDYQRYYTVDGKQYCHIIDPSTLLPPTYHKSVTVITKDSGLADALSTALFCMSYEDGLALLSTLEDVDAFWVFEDGTTACTEGFQNYLVP